jgi:hypothetical protein
LLAHTVLSGPAFTTGGGTKDNIIVSFTGLQPPLLVELNTRVTNPEEVSAAVGMYWAFNVVSFGEKLPVPEVPHLPVPAPPDMFPFKFALPQTSWSAPALTVGFGVIIGRSKCKSNGSGACIGSTWRVRCIKCTVIW